MTLIETTRPSPTGRIRRTFAALLLVLGMTAAATAIPTGTASADTTYYVYESRSTVKWKAGYLGTIDFGCSILPWWAVPWCSTGHAGVAYDFGAYYDCKMRIRVTINSSSQFSWDKATYRYYPYACLG